MIPLFTGYDSYLFHNGTNRSIYRKMGAHLMEEDGQPGVHFVLWAPNAESVSVISEWNYWDENANPMEITKDGIWECFIPSMPAWKKYRYVITGKDGIKRYKSDPYAFYSELRPASASIVCPEDKYLWGDWGYYTAQKSEEAVRKPMAIYEVHLGSWKKDYRNGPDGFLNYRELANQLAEYVSYMGFTHVELIGICEHPFDGSWGYQVTGYYSPTSRYGTPEDFRYFVDTMHKSNIGVILDWVPAHFPKDDFAMENFDGTHVYESDDPLKAEYPEWGTYAFDHSKPEVRSFLISNAFYWIKEFHIDALRVDAVAAMLYSSFGRSEWRPNKFGGTENLESTDFLKQLNKAVAENSNAYLIAEDSSIIPGITKSVDDGGMGFMFKWNMGWMNDTLRYVAKDPIFRRWHHGELTHTSDYAYLENFVLVLSHDEVVHLKRSMLEKFPGRVEDKFGGLKALYTFQMTYPGKKLLFMGQEFAEDREWDENREINWGLADELGNRDVMQCMRNLLKIYKSRPCLYSDFLNPVTFEWVNRYDADRNILSYIRRNPWNYDDALLVIINFSHMEYDEYTCGAPVPGLYSRIFSTYDSLPGGGGPDETEDGIPPIESMPYECDGYENMLMYNLRPFESVIVEFPITDEQKS